MFFTVRSSDNKSVLGTVFGRTQEKALSEAKKKFRVSHPILDLNLTDGGMAIVRRMNINADRMASR